MRYWRRSQVILKKYNKCVLVTSKMLKVKQWLYIFKKQNFSTFKEKIYLIKITDINFYFALSFLFNWWDTHLFKYITCPRFDLVNDNEIYFSSMLMIVIVCDDELKSIVCYTVWQTLPNQNGLFDEWKGIFYERWIWYDMYDIMIRTVFFPKYKLQCYIVLKQHKKGQYHIL